MAFLFFHRIPSDTPNKSRGQNLIIIPLKFSCAMNRGYVNVPVAMVSPTEDWAS